MGVVETNGNRYVTYLVKGNKFDPNNIHTNLSSSFGSKPDCAWWGSPEDSNFGWKEYIKYEWGTEKYDFDNPIKWHLKEGSKIFQIDAEDTVIDLNNDLLKYIFLMDRDLIRVKLPIEAVAKELQDTVNFEYRPRISFYKMLEDGIVAVELMNPSVGHFFANGLETMFNSWDCESIVVLDPSKIIFDQEE